MVPLSLLRFLVVRMQDLFGPTRLVRILLLGARMMALGGMGIMRLRLSELPWPLFRLGRLSFVR